MKYLFSITVLLLVLISCQSQKEMVRSYNSCDTVVEILNRYYVDRNNTRLDTALMVIDNLGRKNKNLETRLVSLKITVLVLKQDYNAVYAFVDGLDDKDNFQRSYQKNYYLKSFEALRYEQQGDSLSGIACFSDLVNDMEKYIDNNPLDKEAIVDMYYVKLRCKGFCEVMHEIDSLKSMRMDEYDFYKSLKESLAAASIR